MADGSGHDSGAELTLQPTDSATSPVRRRALWGVLVVVAMVTGAVVALSSSDDGPPRLPVSLGRFGAAEADAAGAASMSRAAWVTYVAGPDLPALGGRAAAYKVVPAVDEASLEALAEALGLDGTPLREDGVWLLRDGDAMLQVDERGGSWWFSAVSGEVSVSEGSGSGGVAEPGPAADEVAPDEPVALPQPVEPVEPTPPADLPSEAGATQIALDLIASTGQDVTDAKVTVDGPHDSWYVSIEHVVDGLPASGVLSSVSVGAKGGVLHASGWLADIDRLGDYPLIDTSAAIERLNHLQHGVDGGPVPLGADTGARDVGAALEPAPDPLHDPVVASEEGICKVQPDGREICELVVEPAPGPECPPNADCAGWTPYPIDPPPYEQPAPVEVVLHDAEAILTMQWANDGSSDVYLVPGYRFSGDDGALVEVAAVHDDGLAPKDRPEPPVPGQTEPQPSEANPITLEPGQEPELGVGYYVDVNTHCGWFTFADRWWATDEGTPLRGDWAEPTEGGTFTLETPEEGVFVGDAEGKKQARFTAQGPADELPACD